MLQQAQSAMARARSLEQELAAERISVDKGLLKAMFNGTGEIISLKIDPVMVDPEDIESLEDLIVSAIRDGFATATALRAQKVQEIMPNVPGL